MCGDSETDVGLTLDFVGLRPAYAKLSLFRHPFHHVISTTNSLSQFASHIVQCGRDVGIDMSHSVIQENSDGDPLAPSSVPFFTAFLHSSSGLN